MLRNYKHFELSVNLTCEAILTHAILKIALNIPT